jgi:hypothetical protein
MSRRRHWRTSAALARWRSLRAEGYAINSVVKNGTVDPDWRGWRVTTMLSYESAAGEPGAMPCERSHLRFFYAFQVWRRRRSSRNIIRTPSDTNTLRKEPHCSTIHTGNSGSLSALAKRFSTIPTPRNASMLLREPCRATIRTRSSESLSVLTSRP